MKDTVRQIEAEQVVAKIWNKTDLSIIEKLVIKRHFGFSSAQVIPQSLEDIAEHTGLDVEYIELVYKDAMKKFKETVIREDIKWSGVRR